jgi:hypothetical protein
MLKVGDKNVMRIPTDIVKCSLINFKTFEISDGQKLWRISDVTPYDFFDRLYEACANDDQVQLSAVHRTGKKDIITHDTKGRVCVNGVQVDVKDVSSKLADPFAGHAFECMKIVNTFDQANVTDVEHATAVSQVDLVGVRGIATDPSNPVRQAFATASNGVIALIDHSMNGGIANKIQYSSKDLQTPQQVDVCGGGRLVVSFDDGAVRTYNLNVSNSSNFPKRATSVLKCAQTASKGSAFVGTSPTSDTIVIGTPFKIWTASSSHSGDSSKEFTVPEHFQGLIKGVALLMNVWPVAWTDTDVLVWRKGCNESCESHKIIAKDDILKVDTVNTYDTYGNSHHMVVYTTGGECISYNLRGVV